jgi:hypothetical protein
METGVSSARQERARHRHELRTLTYVTLDQANGGIVRNLTHDGIGAQVVAAVRPRQQLRVRFELRYPRLRIETRGEVMWATFSGQCGIRFLDLSPRMARQINEWIFGDLLEGAALHNEALDSGELRLPELVAGRHAVRKDQNDGLMVSVAPLKVIELPDRSEAQPRTAQARIAESPRRDELDWLSQPLSGRGLAWTVNMLAVVAGLLLFVLVFLSVTRELPKWPLGVVAGATILIAAFYWGFFRLFGGTSPGARLARLAGYDFESESAETPATEAESDPSYEEKALRSNG